MKIYCKKSNRISNKRTAWNSYTCIMQNFADQLEKPVYLQGDIIQKYESITYLMFKGVNIATGRKEVNKYTKEESKRIGKEAWEMDRNRKAGDWQKNRQPKEWWDSECQEVIEEKKQKFKQRKRIRNMENFIECKRIRVKKEKLQKFCRKHQ